MISQQKRTKICIPFAPTHRSRLSKWADGIECKVERRGSLRSDLAALFPATASIEFKMCNLDIERAGLERHVVLSREDTKRDEGEERSSSPRQTVRDDSG